jgi:hypothetical protein
MLHDMTFGELGPKDIKAHTCRGKNSRLGDVGKLVLHFHVNLVHLKLLHKLQIKICDSK